MQIALFCVPKNAKKANRHRTNWKTPTTKRSPQNAPEKRQPQTANRKTLTAKRLPQNANRQPRKPPESLKFGWNNALYKLVPNLNVWFSDTGHIVY